MADQAQTDLQFMQRAITLAEQAAAAGEVPVGAVLVIDGKIVGEGANAPIGDADSTAHAEIKAIRQACTAMNNYRLPGSTLYVSLEPCAMCAGAIVHSRIARVVCATREPRAGAAGSIMNVLQHDALNHHCELDFGPCEGASAELLRTFFRARR